MHGEVLYVKQAEKGWAVCVTVPEEDGEEGMGMEMPEEKHAVFEDIDAMVAFISALLKAYPKKTISNEDSFDIAFDAALRTS